MPVSDDRYETYLVVALFLYALPFVHNLLCVEIPFNAGYDLALRYLSVPAAAVVVFGGRRLRKSLGRQGYRVLSQVFVSAVIFGWIVGLGQAYVVLANALLPPQSIRRLPRSEEHTSELQSRGHLVCRLLLE